MKRKFTLLALVLVVVVLATSVLFACNKETNDGKYYKYEDGVKDENSWIEIKGNKWIDDAGYGGTFEEKGDGVIELYDEAGEWFCSGELKDGVLVLDLLFFAIEYRKDGATGSTGDSSQVGNSQVDEKAKVTAIQGGTVDGLTILLDVGPEVTDVELSGMLTVSKNSSWQLYADKTGQTLIPTKYATNLSAGDNLYYVVVNSEDGSINRTYTLSIHKQYYTNIYLKANDTTVKTIEDVLTHTTVELNPPSEMEGYYLTWSTTSYYVAESNKVIEASSTTPKTHTVTLNTEGGKLTGEATHTLTYDSEYTLPVPTKKGYTFMGWKRNGNFVTYANGSSISNFRFDENVNYYADWSVNYYTLNVSSNDTSLGTVNEVSGEKAYGSNVTLVATPKTNCYFKGWYKNSISGSKVSDSLSYTITMEDSSATYVAKFVCYTLTTSTNLTGAGTYSSYNNEKMPLDEDITLTATTNGGYTWLGWYDGETKVSEGTSLTYTFTMGEESKTYTAKWSKVEIEKNITEAGSIAMSKYDGSPTTAVVSFNLNGASGSIASQAITATQGLTYPTIPTRSGYLFAGWYSNSACSGEPFDFSSDVTSNVTLYAKWISHSGYGVLKAGNNGSMTLISYIPSDSSPYRYYAFVPLVSETITIYTTGSDDTCGYLYNSSQSYLTGNNDSGSNNNFSISYAVTAGTLYYIRPCAYGSGSVTATVYIDASTPSSGGKSSNYSYVVGDEATITATTNNGYTWLGWYDGETKVSEGTSLTYTFTMGEDSKTYTAKWELCTSHTLDSNCVCTKCNLAHPNYYGGVCDDCGETLYTRDGSYIYFGTYPQSEVTDSTLKSTLTGSAGALPTSSNSGSWTSYGYYISGSVSNYMWYIDKEYDGEKYRGVYFTSYRPHWTTKASSSSNSYQYDNGYSTGNVYWFKYEPIKWRILSEGSGKALILAELILDSQEFYPSSSGHTENGTTLYANNWEYSTIRKWLNETFYNVAFNNLQKALIVATELDNKTTAIDGSGNSYATCQNNTTDKVFLLSYKDMLNTYYGFSYSSSGYDTSRRKQTSDYAQVQGALTSTDSSYLGNGLWWLRSPSSIDYYASYVTYDGYVGYSYYVYVTSYGVVPALTIML